MQANHDLLNIMQTNASVRTFTADPVSDAALMRILDVARFAPSGGNTQPWHVTVVKNRETRAQLSDLAAEVWTEYCAIRDAGFRPFAVGEDGRFHGHPINLTSLAGTRSPSPLLDALVDAPALLVVSARITAMSMMDVDLERKSFVGGASIYPFMQNILLAARTEGLAGVLATFLARKEPRVQSVLRLPQEHCVAGMIVLGVPTQQITKLKRKPVHEFTTIDTFDGTPLEA